MSLLGAEDWRAGCKYFGICGAGASGTFRPL